MKKILILALLLLSVGLNAQAHIINVDTLDGTEILESDLMLYSPSTGSIVVKDWSTGRVDTFTITNLVKDKILITSFNDGISNRVAAFRVDESYGVLLYIQEEPVFYLFHTEQAKKLMQRVIDHEKLRKDAIQL